MFIFKINYVVSTKTEKKKNRKKKRKSPDLFFNYSKLIVQKYSITFLILLYMTMWELKPITNIFYKGH